MRGRPNHRPSWRPHAHHTMSAEDAKEEDDVHAEAQRHYCGPLCRTFALPKTASRESSPITVLSPIPTRMLATASVASNSASATSSADDANGLASRRPLRQSPAFFENKEEEAPHLIHHKGRRVRRARQSSSHVSSHWSSHSPHPTSALVDMRQPPSNERESDGATVPLSAWGAAPGLKSVPTELCSDDVSLAARHRSDDHGPHHTVAISDSAALEHFHVLELEEQLQYWRQRALHVEGRALRRERELQARWEAEFAAAQTSSEMITRKLLDRQNRLRKQLNLCKSTVRHTAGREQDWRSSKTSMDSVSSAPNSSIPDSGSHHAQKQQQRLRRGHQRNSKLLQEKDPQSPSPTDACNCGGNETEGVHGTLNGSDQEDVVRLRSFVAKPEAENASLLQSLTTLQQERQQLGRSQITSNAAEGAATHHDEAHVSFPAHLQDLCRAALRCMSRSRELCKCHAGLLGKSSDDTQVTNDGHPEEQYEKRLAKGLQDVLSGRQANGVSSSSSLLAQPLLVLHSALEHLDAVLRTCVNDIVLVKRRLAPTSLAGNVPLQQLQQSRDDHCNAELKEQLRKVRAALVQEQQRRATTQSTLNAAVRDMRDFAQAQEECRAKVEHTRAALERDVIAATRRASAAEHQSALHSQREAQWQTRLSALRDERDVYAQECALLKSRLEFLQSARNATVAERAGQVQGRIEKTVPMSQSLVSARRFVKPRPRPVSPGLPTAAVAAASEEPPADVSLPAPRVTSTDMHVNQRTASRHSSGCASPSSAPLSPRRSLSYSLLPSADAELEHAPGEGVHDTAQTHGARLTGGVCTASSGAPRPSWTFSSTPVDVVQPSLLAAPQDSGYADMNALAQPLNNLEGSRGVGKDSGPVDNDAFEPSNFTIWKASSLQLRCATSPSTPSRHYAPMASNATVVGAPLAKMRAWEEKFKAILHDS